MIKPILSFFNEFFEVFKEQPLIHLPKWKRAVCVLGALFVWWAGSGIGLAGTALPFQPGERLVFRVRWVFIPAGEAILEVRPNETVGGEPACHFVATARTYDYIDPLYKLRARVDGYTDPRVRHSVFYKESKHGRSRKEVEVIFDWKKQTAQRFDFGDDWDPIAIPPGSFDPLSIFYAFRLNELTAGGEIKAHVTDGKKCSPGKARVIRREKVELEGGTFDTYLVEPDLEDIGGIFKKAKGGKFKIWVTADNRRIPVKIESEVAVGSFVAELVSVEEEKGHAAAE